MIGDYEEDAHYCLKCHNTILGLDNYVNHRKSSCSKPSDPPKSPLPSQLLPPDEIGLKADDFFSSLELRSSSKKPSLQSTSGKNVGILTRSKTTAVIQASINREQSEPQQSKSGKNIWIGGHQLKELGHGDNQSKLINAVDNLERRKEDVTKLNNVFEESEEESDDYDYDDNESSDDDAPPRNHTGGKWKPSSPIQWGRYNRDWNAPPPNYTGGKWKPLKRLSPPPTHTKGKWKPSYIKEPEDESVPPPSFTGSKWVSSKKHDYHDLPPPSHTKGKWKPRNDNEEDFPPPSHTKGKWKPGDGEAPPPTHTKGKWNSKSYEENVSLSTQSKQKWGSRIESSNEPSSSELSTNKKEFEMIGHRDMFTEEKSAVSKELTADLSPKKVEKRKGAFKIHTVVHQQPVSNILQANYTRGKWLPASQNKFLKISDDSPFRKSSGTVQYWCSPCKRRLASKLVYERHLKSELHFKRTSHEGEFDDGAGIRKMKTKLPTFSPKQTPPIAKNEKKRKRKKTYEKCDVCQSKVTRFLMGKHLVSHYHCRKSDLSTDSARNMILDNIYSVVLQSPFQCGMCKFYCNTHDDFVDHWKSQFHKEKTFQFLGYYWCCFCKIRGPDSEEMLKHLISREHLEVVSVINRSVPIVIKKIMPLVCLTCNREFTLHIQLLNHCRKYRHDNTNVKLYNAEVYNCNQCTQTFCNFISLQRHKRGAHDDRYFLCIPCNLKFKESEDAKNHRKTQEHRYACMKRKLPQERLTRKCEHCGQSFANFLLLKNHLKSEHPEHKKRCPHCGATFTITQELTNHLRSKSCKFEENIEHSYRCEKCPFTSDSTGELLYHIALHDDPLLIYPLDDEEEDGGNMGSKGRPIPRYKCPICEKIYPKTSLQAHIRQHTQERPFVCKICNAAFARKNNMNFHVKNHDRKNEKPKPPLPQKDGLKGEKPFLCSTCGDAFKKKYTLQQHMMVHGEKRCKCPKKGCFYTARKMSEVVEHFRIHCDTRDFACDICDYKAKTKSLLKRHLSIHEDTKKYQCNQCQFTARTSAHLKRHTRLHTGAKPFTCPHCKYKCTTLENLRKHVISTNKHPGKCLYECKYCTEQHPFQSNFAKEFKAHLFTNHPTVFGNRKEATTYVAGIYEAREDNTYLTDIGNDIEAEEDEDITSRGAVLQILKVDTQSGNILQTNKDPIVTQLTSSEPGTSKTKHLDQLLPMFVIPKDDSGNVDSWNLVGRYDVEGSGTLVPFQNDGDSLFQEHF